MKNPMDCKRSRLAKSFSTLIALERLLFAMYISMISQVVLPSKGLSTNITAVWPLISVGSLVDEKIVGLSELPITEFTDELLLLSA